MLHIERAIHKVDVFQPYRTTLVFDTNAIEDDISQLKAVKTNHARSGMPCIHNKAGIAEKVRAAWPV